MDVYWDSTLPSYIIMPQLVDPLGETPQGFEILMTVLNMAHQQSDAAHPILGPRGDHPYIFEGVVRFWIHGASASASSRLTRSLPSARSLSRARIAGVS